MTDLLPYFNIERKSRDVRDAAETSFEILTAFMYTESSISIMLDFLAKFLGNILKRQICEKWQNIDPMSITISHRFERKYVCTFAIGSESHSIRSIKKMVSWLSTNSFLRTKQFGFKGEQLSVVDVYRMQLLKHMEIRDEVLTLPQRLFSIERERGSQ